MTHDKGKVESGVGHAQKTPLKGMRLESPQETQAYLDRWEARWAEPPASRWMRRIQIKGTNRAEVCGLRDETLQQQRYDEPSSL